MQGCVGGEGGAGGVGGVGVCVRGCGGVACAGVVRGFQLFRFVFLSLWRGHLSILSISQKL